ncbi:MAG: ABC transporter ATP-binding protein/permease [Treponema sp.]|jgi:ABC-type multidrug transport system fused ATPase/permease subunit|nr:ABC transporter ATP-binding protein/permease [Treponema sp.]
MDKLRLIFALFDTREKRQLVFVLAALLFIGFIELIGIGSIGPFISVVSNPKVIHANPYLNKVYTWFNFTSDAGFIIALGVAVIIVLVLSNLCLAAANFMIYYYSAKRRHTIAMRLFEQYLRQPYIFYLNTSTADLSKRILNDTGNFISSVLINVLQFISGSIISLCIIFLLIALNPVLALIVSLVLGLSYSIIFSYVKDFLAKKGEEGNTQNFLKYKYIYDGFGGIKDIKILGKEKVFLDFFAGPSKKSAMNEAARDIVNEMPKYLLETIAIGGILGVILFMIHFGAVIDDFLPVLTVYVFGAYRMLPLLQKVFKAAASIKYSFPIVEELYRDFKELPPGNALIIKDIPRMSFHNHIDLEKIVFRYPTGNKDVIRNQSITIASNTSVAFVGFTGCGKTTLADIILGLLEPQSGKLYIDDVEITDDNRKNWQKNLGYVPQSIYLTDDTIRNNIAFGIESRMIDDQAVIKAAQLANIHDFIVTELEKGYDTIIGERGIRLSGGQRQRIGIARAVYHDPSVLVLDEATSALDSLTENAIIDAIKNMSGKKTIIMIAHRITTVKNCDMIYLMDTGIIADQGAYEELYQKNEAFRKMADGV